MKINFRQGVVSHQQGGFLQLTGNSVNILAGNRPVTVSLAHKTTNYTHSEDNSVNAAWTGFFSPTENYWLYWDFNLLTFERTFGYTDIRPIAQSIAPGSGDATIVGVTPGNAGVGEFLVDGYYNLNIGRTFSIINSTGNDGSYTVRFVAYNSSTGVSTIAVDEIVASAVVDGDATLDLDSNGNPVLVNGLHWFDTTSNIQYVYSSPSTWTPVLRVFAAQLTNGSSFISVSQNSSTTDFTGTQIGNNIPVFSGRVLYDDNTTTPFRRSTGTFVTTEDQFFTNQSRVDAIRLEANVTRAQSVASSLAEFSVVAWTGDGKIRAADYRDTGNTVLGLLTEGIIYSEVGAVIIQGTVTNPAWNWTSALNPVPVGSALWAQSGVLVSKDPYITDPLNNPVQHVPIARVLDKDTVIFEQGLGGVGPRGASGEASNTFPANTTSLGTVTLVTASTDPLRAFVISDTDPRLFDARQPLTHSHQASDVTFTQGGGISASNTQDALVELGNGKVDISGATMSGTLTLSADPQNPLEAATQQYVNAVAGYQPLAINFQTGIAYTLGLVDTGRFVDMSNANANVVTVPTNATVAFAVGTEILIQQSGLGQTSIAGSGITFESVAGALKLTSQFSTVTLIKKATDTWTIIGDTSV